MSKKHDTVSGEFLKEVFNSHKFLEINKEAAEETKRNERETAYVVTKEFGNDDPHDVYFSDIIVGKKYSISSHAEVEKIANFIRGKSIYYPLVSAHFHVPDGDLVPSLRDLRTSNRYCWYLYTRRIKPINIIGENIPVKDVDMQDLLLYQQQKPWSIGEWLRSKSSFKKFEASLDADMEELRKEVYIKMKDSIGEDEKYTIYKITGNIILIGEIGKFAPETYKAHILYIQNDEIFPLELLEDLSFTAEHM